MTLKRVHIFIYGRVQGVFFRQSTFEMAQQYNLTGYVRNRMIGSVEAIFEGDEEMVVKMVEWCKTGPPHASVQGVEIVTSEPISTKLYQFFSIESTH